jgi:hypothetical protein
VLQIFPHLRHPDKLANVGVTTHDHYHWLRSLLADRVDTYQETEADHQWVLMLRVDSSDWAWGDEHLSADLRGRGTPDYLLTWSRSSRVRVALRARTNPGGIFLHLRRQQQETSADAVRRDWFSASGSEKLFDVFLAWRCRCPVETRYEIRRVDDLPNEPGPHGNCPGCGATPLLVEVLK